MSVKVDNIGIQLKTIEDLIVASKNIDDGTATGQFAWWNGSKWTYAETSEMVWDDTNKRLKPKNLLVTETFQNYNPDLTDIGVEQINDVRGYGVDYISKKLLSRVQVGTVADEVEGAIRNNAGVFQIYLNEVWNDIVINFRFREDDSGAYELEHKPVGFDFWIEVNSGNSNALDLNGLPIIQQYKTSIGAYQVPLQIDGGTF